MKRRVQRITGLIGLAGAFALLPVVATQVAADTVRSEVELTTKDVRSKESALADTIADAIRAIGKSDASFIAASFFTEGGVTLPKGSVSTNDVLKALDYRDANIVVVKLTGDQIRRALEQSVLLYPKPNSGFLHFSGLTVTVNPDATGGDKRIGSIKVGGDALEAGKSYKVAMPAPLASGALAYFKIWKDSDKKDSNKTLETAVTEYLADHKTIAKSEDRLVIKGK